MKAILLAAAALVAIGADPLSEPTSNRSYVQSQMRLIGLCDWWLAWGDKQVDPVPVWQAAQWDHTCRDYHTAKI